MARKKKNNVTPMLVKPVALLKNITNVMGTDTPILVMIYPQDGEEKLIYHNISEFDQKFRMEVVNDMLSTAKEISDG